MNSVSFKATTKRAFHTGILTLLGLTLLGAATLTYADGVVRKRVAVGEQTRSSFSSRAHNTENGAARVQRRVTDGEHGNSVRRSTARSDGEGNAYRRDTKAYQGDNGGQGYKVTQGYRKADGSAHRSTQKSIDGANGGSFDSNKQTSRNADGELSHNRTISGQTADGKSYETSLNVENGTVTRSSSCSDAAGNSVECR